MDKVYLEDIDIRYKHISRLQEALARYEKHIPSEEGYLQRKNPVLDVRLEMWGDPGLLEEQRKAEEAAIEVREIMDELGFA